jgi:hypothetical protein
VHVNRAPKINPNNWVILRSLMSSLPSLTLVARIILSVQNRRVGAEELQPANSNGLASFLGVPGEIRRRRSRPAETAAHCRHAETAADRRIAEAAGYPANAHSGALGEALIRQATQQDQRPSTNEPKLSHRSRLAGVRSALAYGRYTGAEAAKRFRRRSSKRREKCTRSTVGGCARSTGLIFGLPPRHWGDLSARFWARPPTVCR